MSSIRPEIQLELAREIARKIEDRETKARIKQLESRLLWPSTEPRDTLADSSEFISAREARAADLERRDLLAFFRGAVFAMAILAAVAAAILVVKYFAP